MRNKIYVLSMAIVAVMLIFGITITGCASIRDLSENAAPAYDEMQGYGESGAVINEYDGKASSDILVEEAAVETTAMEYAESEEAMPDSADQELYTQAGSSDVATAQAMATKLIKNGYIQVEVKEGEFEAVFFKVSSLAGKYNGYVSSSQNYSDASGKMTSGVVILRIDKNNFDAVLNEIKSMGNVLNVSINVSDVTQEYVDNESRLKNLEAQQKRLLELMEKSVTVKDSIEVQRELSNIEGQIEVIKGRQNYLDNLIAYSTIEVSITEPIPIVESTEGGFIGAVKRGARGALTFLKVATTVLIGISPLLVLIGIILIIIWQSLRARNRKRAGLAKKKEPEENKKI